MIVTSIPAAAKAIGVAQRTVATWLAAGAPGEPGKYDVEALKAWRDRMLRPPTSYDHARRREPVARTESVVDVARRFARDLLSPDSGFTRLLASIPSATRDHLAVDILFFLFCTVEEYAPIDKAALFAELGLSKPFAVYHSTHKKLGLNVDESEA